MTNSTRVSLRPPLSSSPSAFVGTMIAVVVCIVAFLFFDLSLAAIDRRESDAHAADAYARGVTLLGSGKAAAALEEFRTAIAIDRSNLKYALALSQAQLDAGDAAAAESTLKVLLIRTENDGAVNLTMAHVMAHEGRANDAKAYFHRAVYGRWGLDSVRRRADARFELIDLLAKHGTPTELLAELLPLEDVSVDSVALRLHLGKLFLQAGSPARAVTMFRGILDRDADNADAFAGMGQAALALGNFHTARNDFSRASRLRPNDSELSAQVALADTVLALDPTSTGIDRQERVDRGRRLVTRTLAALASCGEANAPGSDSARALVVRKPGPHASGTFDDTLVDAAAALWAARSSRCDRSIHDEPLRLVQRHLVP
jgi:tetratricopeptide (TPR) repeat protein